MPQQTADKSDPQPRRGRLKRWLVRITITVGILAVLFGSGVGVAEYRTSQPGFCASCHIMEPYYESWQADLHGGKLEVACVECHYAPGQRTTVKAKLRGLSQVASYFSGRYGTTRPRAHVSNASCLTSKCHGDMKFMDTSIRLGTVEFTHANHLRRSDEQEEPNLARLAELESALRELAGEERFSELQAAVQQAGPAEQRYEQLVSLSRKWDVPAERDQLVEFSQLSHRKVRLAQLDSLQCTTCHMYQSDRADLTDGGSSHHFTVQTTTCYTCHFNNEGFNTGTASCLLCHDPPAKEITIHKELGPEASKQLDAPQLQAKPVTMNHEEILARNVDCVACHADVASEDSVVSRRDCERCHDQPRFFADWNPTLALDVVARYHSVHVPEQRAKCLDCHSEIKHRLVHEDEVEQPGTFLAAALANCTHCHPNHHTDQVKLLLGKGGQGVAASEPNPMFGARTNCYGCHSEAATGAKGHPVLTGTEATCVACHGEGYASLFEQWKAGVEFTLEDAQQAYDNARKALEEKTDAMPEARKKAERLLAVAEADLNLVKRGNGIHNVTYSIELLDSVTTHAQQAIEALSQE